MASQFEIILFGWFRSIPGDSRHYETSMADGFLEEFHYGSWQ